MNQQEMADLLEIQQLAARYMMFVGAQGARTAGSTCSRPTACTTRSARRTPRRLPDAPEERAARPVHRQRARRRVRRRHRHRGAALRVHRPDHPRDAPRLVRRRVRAHPRRLAHPPRSTTFMRRSGAFDHGKAHDPARFVAGQEIDVGGEHAHRHHDRARDPQLRRQGRPAVRRRQGGRRGRVRDRVDPAAPAGLRRHDRGRARWGGRRAASSSAPRWCRCSSRHPIALGQQALSVQAVCGGRFTPRRRAVAPLDRRRHARPALRAAGAGGRGLPRRVRRHVRGTEPGRRRERPLPHPQPARHHRHRADARAARRARPGDAADRGGADRRHRALDGRRARDRRARRAADHEGGRERRAGPRRAWSPASRSACAAPTRSTRRASAPTASSVTPSTRRTTSGCSSTATPPTWATSRRWVPRPTWSAGCARSPTPAPPTSRCGSCPSGKGRDELVASSRRTREFLATLAPELT